MVNPSKLKDFGTYLYWGLQSEWGVVPVEHEPFNPILEKTKQEVENFNKILEDIKNKPDSEFPLAENAGDYLATIEHAVKAFKDEGFELDPHVQIEHSDGTISTHFIFQVNGNVYITLTS